MPTYKKYRKRRYKKGNYLKRQVYKNKSQLQTLNKAIEYKYQDVAVTTQGIHTTATFHCLNASITQSVTGQHSRIGNQLTAKKIRIRGVINNSHGTPADGVLRLILVRYKTASGRTPVFTDIFQTKSVGGDVSTILSFRNTEHMKDFDVMIDTTFAYDTVAHTQIPFKIVRKLKHNVEYNDTATTGAVTTIESNSLWLVALSNHADEPDSPLIGLEWRYTFSDL